MTRKTIYTIHKPNAAHLAAVMADMDKLGSPTIRVVDCGDHYKAVEGTHRLHAAANLGIAVTLDVITEDTIVTGHDIADLPKNATALDILDNYSVGAGIVTVDVA